MQLDHAMAVRLMAFFLFERLGRQHPKMPFLSRVSVASKGAVAIMRRLPDPLPQEWIDRFCRLCAGDLSLDDPVQAFPTDIEDL